jgi:hypothetical protein
VRCYCYGYLRPGIENDKTGANMTSTRRLSERIPFRKRVKYGLSNHALAGYTFNLSEDGIGIKSNRVFSSRSKIVIQICISGTDLQESSMDEIIKLEGTVAWVSPVLPGILPTMGIKFSNRSNDIRRIYLQRTN